jgi:hypothetical protein
MTYKYGRLPRDTSRWAPTLETYFRPHAAGVGLEAVPSAMDVDRASEVTEWPMYVNDEIGDCTVAAQAHCYTAMSVFAGKPQPLFSDREIVKGYTAVSGYDPATGANDNGAEMQDVLKYNLTHGMKDLSGKTHKITAYAALGRPTDVLLLSECLKTFGAVYVGINCPESAQEQFGQIWTYVPGSPIEGGHAIGLHRRMPYSSRIGVWDFSTWGALQWVNIPFISHYVEEAWVFTTEDWIEANGVSCDGLALSALEADMRYV